MKERRKWIALLLAAVLVLSATEAVGASPTDDAYILDNGGYPLTCRAFSTQLAQDGYAYVQIMRDNVEVEPQENVATGMELCSLDENGELLEQRPIAVLGDVVGTGVAGLNQVVRIAQCVTGEKPLSGIYLLAADIDGSGRVGLGDLVLAAKEASEVATVPSVELTSRPYPLYFQAEEPLDTVDITFVNGQDDIPYIGLDALVRELLPLYIVSYDLEETEDGVFVITREDGYWAEIDCNNDLITFLDYDAFFRAPYASTILDVCGDVSVLSRPDGSFERYGLPVSIDLGTYGIDLVSFLGHGYIPLQTASDFFLAKKSVPVVFNGEGVFISAGGSLGAASDAYYSVPPKERSAALAEFTYNELCACLDSYYGLKEQHNIQDFDTLFRQTGLADGLLSTDPEQAAEALSDLLAGILGDSHSGYQMNSFLLGEEPEVVPTMVSSSLIERAQARERFEGVRNLYYPDGPVPYEEVGNTAYITFDSFDLSLTRDYSDIVPEPVSNDTVELIMYAHEQIMREDSPIENVVIDLSLNGGGALDAATAVAAWYLGVATLNLNSTFTEAQASTRYRFDINRDGAFDENDSVSSKRLFCMTSPISFSSGNLVPACLKESGVVTMIGQDSRGGACTVLRLSAADGTLFCISGPSRLSTLTNGSFYDIDKGIDVDVPIRQIPHFYDREALTQFINGIYR